MTDKRYLVWYRYLGKLTPQVWTYKPPAKSLEGGLSVLMATHEVAEDDWGLGLDAIAEKYPYKDKAD